jgi:hypothetical protein
VRSRFRQRRRRTKEHNWFSKGLIIVGGEASSRTETGFIRVRCDKSILMKFCNKYVCNGYGLQKDVFVRAKGISVKWNTNTIKEGTAFKKHLLLANYLFFLQSRM